MSVSTCKTLEQPSYIYYVYTYLYTVFVHTKQHHTNNLLYCRCLKHVEHQLRLLFPQLFTTNFHTSQVVFAQFVPSKPGEKVVWLGPIGWAVMGFQPAWSPQIFQLGTVFLDWADVFFHPFFVSPLFSCHAESPVFFAKMCVNGTKKRSETRRSNRRRVGSFTGETEWL